MISAKCLATCCAALTVALGMVRNAHARDAFEVTLNVDGQAGSRGFENLSKAIDVISNTPRLQALVPGYTDFSPARIDVNLRGLAAAGTFGAGSPVLRVSIPAAGVDETFAGTTREESGRLFRRWLERNSSPVLRAAVQNTPTDPVAGNPNSLSTRMATADFDLALADAVGPSSEFASTLGDAVSPASGGFGLGARFSSFSAAGYRSNTFSIPLNYAWRLSERDTLQVDVPLSFSDLEGGQSYSGNIGVLWRRRVLPNWSLQPSLRIGGVGSVDLGAGAGVWSAALNSTVKFDLPAAWQLTIANGISYVSTIPVSVGRYSLDYNISNVVFRNGVVASRDLGFRVWNYAVRGAAFAIDTRFTGDDVYTSNYQEFGAFLSLGTPNPLSLGLTYLTGEGGIRGFSVNLGARF
jgi:hypothetical protein